MSIDGPEESEAFFEESYERDVDSAEINERLADDGTEERLIQMDSLRYTLLDVAQERLSQFVVDHIIEGSNV